MKNMIDYTEHQPFWVQVCPVHGQVTGDWVRRRFGRRFCSVCGKEIRVLEAEPTGKTLTEGKPES